MGNPFKKLKRSIQKAVMGGDAPHIQHRKDSKSAAATAAADQQNREEQLKLIPPPPILELAPASPAADGSESSLALADELARVRALIASQPLEEEPTPWVQPQLRTEAQVIAEEQAAQQETALLAVGLVVIVVAFVFWRR